MSACHCLRLFASFRSFVCFSTIACVYFGFAAFSRVCRIVLRVVIVLLHPGTRWSRCWSGWRATLQILVIFQNDYMTFTVYDNLSFFLDPSVAPALPLDHVYAYGFLRMFLYLSASSQLHLPPLSSSPSTPRPFPPIPPPAPPPHSLFLSVIGSDSITDFPSSQLQMTELARCTK